MIAVKKFALIYPKQLENCCARVRGHLVQVIKDGGDKDYSYPLHYLMHSAWSNGSRSLSRIEELANVESEKMDVNSLVVELRSFFNEYEWN